MSDKGHFSSVHSKEEEEEEESLFKADGGGALRKIAWQACTLGNYPRPTLLKLAPNGRGRHKSALKFLRILKHSY